VLAVDDELDILEYFRDIAKGLSIAICDIALSGSEAIDLIDSNGAYDMYFIDWKMPGMNGIELTRIIKEHGSADNSIIVMISSAEWSTISDDAKKAGVDRFLPKPLFPSSIADLINQWFGVAEPTVLEAEDMEDGVFEGYRVLLAEDVDINREIVQALLEPTLLTIDCAENGAEAVRMFTDAPENYDIILMDVQMPEMDGYEATRRIRALNLSRARTIPIIAMTANVFREDVEKCLAAGMNEHVGKPLDFLEVMATLRKYLGAK
jgi:CheY-like chemotaxis protein